MLDDVVDDVGRGVVDAACFFDFWFFLDDGAVAFGKADNLAEELLVDLSEDFGGQNGKLVGAVGIIEVGEDVFEYLVVDAEVWCVACDKNKYYG